MFLGNFEPLTAPDALDPVTTYVPARFFQQRVDPSIAVSTILGSQRNNGLCQRIFVSTQNDRVTLRATRLANEPAGLALREIILLSNPLDRLPAPVERMRSTAYKFPEAFGLPIDPLDRLLDGLTLQDLLLQREVSHQPFQASVFLLVRATYAAFGHGSSSPFIRRA